MILGNLEKHGYETLRPCRSLERLNIRYRKTDCDLKFLLARKKENLLPTFAKPKINVSASKKLKSGIGKLRSRQTRTYV